jgi:DNA-binding protein H-NS
MKYQELLEKIKATEAAHALVMKGLRAEAEAARQEEMNAAREKVLALMDASGITLEDLKLGSGKSKKTGVRKLTGPVAVKYRNSNGETWTGRGREPKWLKGQNRGDFAVSN